MRTTIAMAAAAAAITLAGCNPGATASNSSAGNAIAVSGMSGKAGVAPLDNATMAQATPGGPVGVPQDARTFAMQATMSDRFEIESSKVAVEKSKNPQVKQYAAMMVNAHNETTRELRALMGRASISSVPEGLDTQHAALTKQLLETPPAAFDQAYLDAQVAAHRTTLAAMEGYAAHGDNPALKGFAAQTAPKVRQHLEMATKLGGKG